MSNPPIDVQVGPDGAIYVADWYNPIIQPGEVDSRDERRDRTRGPHRPPVARPERYAEHHRHAGGA